MKWALTLTECSMLLYWLLAALVVSGLVFVSPDWMYSDYENPLVVSWNWSFLPVDVLFAVTGLVARFGRISTPNAQVLRITSLALMFCAGLMAVSFWTLQCWFDALWWGLNVWLMVLSGFALSRILTIGAKAEAV